MKKKDTFEEILGGILMVAAVLVSSISTMRLKPKQILAQME